LRVYDSNGFLFLSRLLLVLPEIFHLLHKTLVKSIIVGELIDYFILFSCIFGIRFIGERELLHLFIEKVDVIGEAHDRHCKWHDI
jgi:hypothetical protein